MESPASRNAWGGPFDHIAMNDLSPHDAELIIEAAAAGDRVPGHELIGDTLTCLHAPASPGALGSAPTLDSGNNGVVARLTRRTAIGASAAVLGVAGVAAAATGGVELLDPIVGDDPPAVVIEQPAEETDGGGGEESPAVEESDPAGAVKDADGDDGDADGLHPKDPIDGVDPSDGLSDEELVTLCEEAVNHGQYVSAVARDRVTEHDGTHGDRVSTAAKMDCPTDDMDDEVSEPESEPAAPFDEVDANGREDGERPGNGRGNAHGHDKEGRAGPGNNGRGNANGHAKGGDQAP